MEEDNYIPVTSLTSGVGQLVTPDVFCYPIQVVNCYFYGKPYEPHDWVLIDAGMPKSHDNILEEAKEHFGEDNKPKAIILTHGHFDHVGAVEELANHWDVPVYAHYLELPYLTGKKDYPEPDSSVEGGLVAKMSRMFPNEGIDLGTRVQKLPEDGTVPEMPGWRWIHTPGHTPGHVSFFRDEDRTLIAGDAFITVRQDQLFKVLTQAQEISGPPRYLTTDWQAAYDSVKKLQALNPYVAATGHGTPLSGEDLTDGLKKLVEEFEEIAVPDHGKFVSDEED
ncbi:MBL fold metallo-hydrolase [Pseudalkalibacillus caeni]|uniref:MBL fold metallo-hydrolase n=1 Tax=Exobacillus caeni TaxID=2574798 RepID=A0A5R9F0P9_9BACL|nr:MBL fold metallo-hydrolase [Pseudalkalibacillus caeni]TLS37127.1 MBL fold metallo-hydrolase [Pseudalkalibacillus caeni]